MGYNILQGGALDIQVVANGRIGLVTLPSYFDFRDKNTLVERIPEWIKSFGLTLVIFNFTETAFVGSSGVYPFFQFLAKSTKRSRGKKVRFAIIGISSEHERLLEGMRIKHKFFLYPNHSSFVVDANKTLELSHEDTQAILACF